LQRSPSADTWPNGLRTMTFPTRSTWLESRVVCTTADGEFEYMNNTPL
jgi:hypothetical protein